MKKMLVYISAVLLAAGLAYGAQNHVRDPGSVVYSNSTGSKIISGTLVDLGYRYGVAGAEIDTNKTGVVFTDGIWLLGRADTNAIALGANVYQSTASNVTGTAGAGKYVGQCIEAVTVTTSVTNSDGSISKFVKVDVGAPQRQIIVGTDVQPYSTNLVKLATNDGARLSGVPITVTVTKQTVTPVFAATNAPTVTVTKETVTPVFAATNAPSVTVTKETATLNYAATNDPAVTVTKQVATLNYAATNDPSISKQTATLNYAATNDPAVTVTKQVVTLNYAATNDPAVVVTVTPSGCIWYDSTGVACTNAAGTAVVVVTQVLVSAAATVTAGAAVDAMTNATAAATLTAGAAVAAMTNATATLTAGTAVDAMTNATAAATLTAGAAVAAMTNATAAATLTTGQSVAIMTNATAAATLTTGASVAIMTNATATATNP